MTTKAHERRRLETKAQTDEWIAKHGEPVCQPIIKRPLSKLEIARMKKRMHLSRHL